MFVLGHVGFAVLIIFLILLKQSNWRVNFDIRWLVFGTLLPDLIDKTIGLLILREYVDNGRIYAHTLLFSVLLTFVAYKYLSRITISISFGAWTHLAFDRMWEVPETFFWPAFRWDFPKTDFYPGKWIEQLITDPYIYTSEIIGAVILLSLFFYWKLYDPDNWRKFWRTGDFPK